MSKKNENEKPASQPVTVSPPKMQTAIFQLVGTSPLVQSRFSQKAKQAIMEKMAAGSTSQKGKKREARNFDEDFRNAMHVSSDGWVGVPAPAIRNACIDACRMVGFKMTVAKMSVFVEADGYDRVDGMPLIRLTAGEPELTEMPVRNSTGVLDIRVRPMWREWSLTVRIQFDSDQFSPADVANLLLRAGTQVGIGEGRPFSRQSNGLGFGCFKIVN